MTRTYILPEAALTGVSAPTRILQLVLTALLALQFATIFKEWIEY
jgi:hypothetical protein